MQTPEISDVIVSYDPESLARKPVIRDDVVAMFIARGNKRAAKVVKAIPVNAAGELDQVAVDQLLLKVHAEIQRLSEEFQQGARIKAILKPLLEALRKQHVEPPFRVVDIGCGTGYMVRWLAAFGDLPDDVELVGADYNAALIERARRLARAEGLNCKFEVANAFALKNPATLFLSIGVIHHFRGDDLITFFQQQSRESTQGFLHFDIKSSWLAPLGAWLFHVSRMKTPLSKHDGVLSAIRAHSSERMMEAAEQGAPDFRCSLFDEDRSPLPILKVMHAIVGVRPELTIALEHELGPDRGRLEVFR